MTQTAISYARALYELEIPKNDIQQSKEILSVTDELYESLVSPVISYKEKEAVIDRVFPETLKAFFKVLCRNQSICCINDIFEAYKEYTYKKENILAAKLYYVERPDKEQEKQLINYLAKRFNKDKVELEYISSPKLIGGFVIEAGGIRIDESIQGKLNRLQQKLVKR